MAHADEQQRGADGIHKVQSDSGNRARAHGFLRPEQVQQGQRSKGSNDKPTDLLRSETPDQTEGIRGDDQLQRACNPTESSDSSNSSNNSNTDHKGEGLNRSGRTNASMSITHTCREAVGRVPARRPQRDRNTKLFLAHSHAIAVLSATGRPHELYVNRRAASANTGVDGRKLNSKFSVKFCRAHSGAWPGSSSRLDSCGLACGCSGD